MADFLVAERSADYLQPNFISSVDDNTGSTVASCPQRHFSHLYTEIQIIISKQNLNEVPLRTALQSPNSERSDLWFVAWNPVFVGMEIDKIDI